MHLSKADGPAPNRHDVTLIRLGPSRCYIVAVILGRRAGWVWESMSAAGRQGREVRNSGPTVLNPVRGRLLERVTKLLNVSAC